MTEGLADLTDKERETLRLMVLGHDAKSMAGELDLSVHTINERLRTARRKLGVTSSREAARLLFESEGGTYEILVDKDLGDADRGASAEFADVPAAGRRATRPVALILAGVLVMMTLFAAGLILTSHFADPAQQTAPVEAPASDAAVVEAARDWLELGDAGDWQAGFDTAGKAFRDVNTVAGWTSAAKQVRVPLGALVSREVRTVRFLNAPPHGFQEVVFATRYANADDEVTETVTLEQEEGVWKVVGILLG